MENKPLVRIAIADDSSLTRYSLSKLLTLSGGFSVVVEASNGQELIDKIEANIPLPDICILDIGMPIMDGYKTLAEFKKRWPLLKTLMLSVHCAEYSIINTISLGARGFLSKDGAMSRLHEALLAIYYDGYYYSEIAPKELYDEYTLGRSRQSTITEREKEILEFIVLGYTNKEIAETIGLAKRTIESYRDILCAKLKVNTKAELIMVALKNELVQHTRL